MFGGKKWDAGAHFVVPCSFFIEHHSSIARQGRDM